MKFKVGDRVRIINDDRLLIARMHKYAGKNVVITECIYVNHSHYYGSKNMYRIDVDNGCYKWFENSFNKLANEEVF